MEILEKAKSKGTYAVRTDQYKALLIYESIMDTVTRNKAGVNPLKSSLDKIAGIQNLNDLQTILGTETAVSAPFAGLVSFPNLSNSNINAPYISTGGLGLPDRDYYLDQDAKSIEIRAQYIAHVSRMLQYIGETEKQARDNANIILAIETKLDKFTVKIGYPDEWEDYSSLAVKDGNSYFENMIAVATWGFQKNINEINEPVDKTEWNMSPQTVNAYFNPFFNEIVFPAAILQPPFYNYTADEAVNYGGIGAVIGHEISHAFDDSGARFDAAGNLSNWWTEDDLTQFTERGGALAEQYSAIEVLDSVFINGKFTLGENIGDLGGVLGAYDGLQIHLAEKGRPEDIDGFTPEQRFFMSWATVWRTKTRENALRTQIKTDSHSPGTVRAIQPLLNVQAFYDAFDIKEGDKMYLNPEKRVKIW